MALYYKDTALTHHPEELTKLKEREQKWLWCDIASKQKKEDKLPPENLYDPILRLNDIATYFDKHRTSRLAKKEYLQHIKNGLVPEKSLEWIKKDDHRLQIWLLIRLNELQYPVKYIYDVPDTERKSEILLAFDISSTSLYQKEKDINYLKHRWSEAFTSNKETKWIEQGKIKQLTWCWEYLVKYQQQLTSLSPVNQEELYWATLSSFDFFKCDHPAEKALFISRMRKSWQQKKYRDSDKAKDQRSLAMSDQTKEQLDLIASHNEEKLHETLARIIKKEFKSIPN